MCSLRASFRLFPDRPSLLFGRPCAFCPGMRGSRWFCCSGRSCIGRRSCPQERPDQVGGPGFGWKPGRSCRVGFADVGPIGGTGPLVATTVDLDQLERTSICARFKAEAFHCGHRWFRWDCEPFRTACTAAAVAALPEADGVRHRSDLATNASRWSSTDFAALPWNQPVVGAVDQQQWHAWPIRAFVSDG